MIEYYKLRQNQIHRFQPKIIIHSERGPFIVKTATSAKELTEAFRLRYQVFHREMIDRNQGTLAEKGIDIDEFDFLCDHLVIIEKKTEKIVGTYRLNCSLFSSQFYSAQEFNLRRILELPGVKLELGRACIHKDFRKGTVIALLWRGIADYMAATKADHLFGCASIQTESVFETALLYTYFAKRNYFEAKYFCPPTKAYTLPDLSLWIHRLQNELSLEQSLVAENIIPSLCRAYLNAGAYLGGEPAYDAEFKCIDFLTILPRENLNKALWRKYNLCPTPTSGKNSDSSAAYQNPA